MSVIFQTKRDTAANWTSNDPTMADGEMGFESDTNRFKIGDGSTAWISLDYIFARASYCELSTISVSHSTTRVMTFTEDTDTDDYFGFNTSRIAVPFTGLYHIIYNFRYGAANAAFRYFTSININRAGSTTFFHDIPPLHMIASMEAVAGQSMHATNSGIAHLTAGDYIEIIMSQSGATRTISATLSKFQMRFLALT